MRKMSYDIVVLGHITKDNLVIKYWSSKKDVLRKIHTVKADRAEAEVTTGDKDLARAAKIIASWGSREVVITHTDGVMVYADEELFEVPFVVSSLKGRTGRGDTCISAYHAARLKLRPGAAAKFAAARTSLKLEQEGPFDRSYQHVLNNLADDYQYGGLTE